MAKPKQRKNTRGIYLDGRAILNDLETSLAVSQQRLTYFTAVHARLRTAGLDATLAFRYAGEARQSVKGLDWRIENIKAMQAELAKTYANSP